MAYIRARVSEESADGWRLFCRVHGVSLSAMVEALGPLLGEWSGMEVSERGEQVIRRAREIDEERRRRR